MTWKKGGAFLDRLPIYVGINIGHDTPLINREGKLADHTLAFSSI